MDGYNAFIDPRYAALVNRNPSPAEIEELLAYPFLNYTAFEIPGRHCCGPPADLSDSFVIIDNRLRNTAISRTRGLDLGLSYSLATYAGSWRFSLAGTYLLEKLRRISQHDSGSDILNTVRNPADLKLRAGVSWSRADLAAHFFINYIGSYRDEGVQPAERVDAWIPLDLNLSYLLREGKASFGGGLLENIRFSLTAHNLLDEEPPFVSDAKAFVSGLYFDANNANPLGRFVSLTLTKEW